MSSTNSRSTSSSLEQTCDSAKLFRVRPLVFLGALLPGLGCYFCIAYTYAFQLDRVLNFTVATCPEVRSIVPPVSWIIGIWEPQKMIWLFVMFIHIPPRLFFLFLYNRLYLSSVLASSDAAWYRGLVWWFMRTMWIEPMGLVAVTIVDIEGCFVLHAIFYTIWVTAFCFNMLFNTLLHHYSGICDSNTLFEITFRIKVFMFGTGTFLAVSTAVSYPLFLAFCLEEGYVAFAITEYLLVGYNSFFHFLTYWEFPRSRIGMSLMAKIYRTSTEETIIVHPKSIDKLGEVVDVI